MDNNKLDYAITNGKAVITRSPGFTSVINPGGQRVLVPRNFESIFPHLFEGKEILPKKYIFNPGSQEPAKLWIERVGGGYGDIIHCLSAIEDKVLEFREEHGNFARIELCVPKQHGFLLSQIKNVSFVFTEDFGNFNYLQHTIVEAREHIDLLCPADDYEHDVDYDVQKSRVELFYEACHVKRKPRPPMFKLQRTLENPFPKDKLVIGICPRSADGYKDWSLDRFEELANYLQEEGHFVFVADAKVASPGIPALPRMTMESVTQYLSWADLVIAPDTGPIFIAAAMGITVIGLFGKTSGLQLLEKFYPTGHAIQVIKPDSCQRPCYQSPERGFRCEHVHIHGARTYCMDDISTEMVIETFKHLNKSGMIGVHRFDREESQNAFVR